MTNLLNNTKPRLPAGTSLGEAMRFITNPTADEIADWKSKNVAATAAIRAALAKQDQGVKATRRRRKVR